MKKKDGVDITFRYSEIISTIKKHRIELKKHYSYNLAGIYWKHLQSIRNKFIDKNLKTCEFCSKCWKPKPGFNNIECFALPEPARRQLFYPACKYFDLEKVPTLEEIAHIYRTEALEKHFDITKGRRIQ